MPDRSCWYERSRPVVRRHQTSAVQRDLRVERLERGVRASAFPFSRPVAMFARARRASASSSSAVDASAPASALGAELPDEARHWASSVRRSRVTARSGPPAATRACSTPRGRCSGGSGRAAQIGPAAVDPVTGVAQAGLRRQDRDRPPPPRRPRPRARGSTESPQHGPSTLPARSRRTQRNLCPVRAPRPQRRNPSRSLSHPAARLGAWPAPGPWSWPPFWPPPRSWGGGWGRPGTRPALPARVVRAVDGDTIVVAFADGHTDTVHVLGVDTPETHDPRKPVQCFGPEAAAYTASRLTGKVVRLESDVETRDKYGRRLAPDLFALCLTKIHRLMQVVVVDSRDQLPQIVRLPANRFEHHAARLLAYFHRFVHGQLRSLHHRCRNPYGRAVFPLSYHGSHKAPVLLLSPVYTLYLHSWPQSITTKYNCAHSFRDRFGIRAVKRGQEFEEVNRGRVSVRNHTSSPFASFICRVVLLSSPQGTKAAHLAP